ncbi:MAG TPA: ROK family protein [Sphingomicrobium sp.]|nr:ROK family protein [Sphingomicrobium sp.]
MAKSTRRRRGATTIEDVSRAAGVSPMTVSRVINGSTNVRESTRSSVLKIIERLNYSPNSAARSLAAGQPSFAEPDGVDRRSGSASGSTYAGVELGGTKCVAILARGPEDVLARVTLPTVSPERTIPAIAAILRKWQSEEGFEALGIASFGPAELDSSSPNHGHLTNTPKAGWAGADVVGPLRRAAGVPVAFDTDVNGAALAEMRWGLGLGFADFAYVTVGTGVGVGLVANGLPMRGFAHCELGHIRVPRLPNDKFEGSCPFHGDCVEGLASGPSLIARLGSERASALSPDDPVWESVSWALAQLCHVIVCAAAPRAIAIGGGVADNHPHLLDRINSMLVESLNGYMVLPREEAYARAPLLGEDAGPLGSVALAMTVAP